VAEVPAIEGGTPVREQLIPYGHHWIDDADIAAVSAVLKSDWITQGENIAEFEAAAARYSGTRYAVAVSSGTAALHAACAVAGIGAGDEAVVPAMTFAATASAVTYCGGTPVFCDVLPDTLNADPADMRGRITERTKALLPVDFAGHPADLDEVISLAREAGAVVIEDAAHSLGATYRGRSVGSLADMTVLSFHPVKHITTGEGGMVLTDNPEYYQRLIEFRHHGIVRGDAGEGGWFYRIERLGHNFRITDFQCVLGLSQLGRLDSFIARRREIAARYLAELADVPEITLPVTRAYVTPVYHLFVIQLNLEMLNVGRARIYDALRAENIGVGVHYIPVHLHPFYQREYGYAAGDFPVAEAYYARALTLPLFPAMSDTDVSDVIHAVRKVIEYYRAAWS
jgi:perosamine synthetase